MNIIGTIREMVSDGQSVSAIKCFIHSQAPQYNTYWVEEEWIKYQFKTGKTIPQVHSVISTSGAFHSSWLKFEKLSKFFNKLNGVESRPTVDASAIRKIATGTNIFDEDRTFGIEIEFNRPMEFTWNKIVAELERNKIAARIADRTDYVDTSMWRICHDGSVGVAFEHTDTHVGNNEIKSPILNGLKGLAEVKKVLKVLRDNGCKINNSCGLHVHHGFKNKNDGENARIIFNCCILYNKFKGKIAKILPKDRSHSRFCRNFRRYEIQSLHNRYVLSNEQLNQSYLTIASDRSRAVNIIAYGTHGTLEFRAHSGTLDEMKTINWIILTQCFMNTAEEYMQRKINLLAHNFSPIHRELRLNTELTSYMKRRAEELKVSGGKEIEYHGEVVLMHGRQYRRGNRGYRRRY